MLRNAALSETLEAAYRDADFCAFADLYGKGRTDKAAGEAVLQVYDFLRALPDYDKKLDEMLAPWQDENGFARTCWHDILMQEAARSARAAKELLCAARNDCREDFVTAQADAEASKKTPAAKEKAVAAVNEKFAEPLERLENSAALLGEVERLAGAGKWTPLYDRLTPYVLGMEQAPGLKNMKKRLTGEHKDAVKTRADEAAKLFEKIEDLISCSLDEAELDRKAAEPCLRALFAAVRDFDARFAARKRERRLLEFSDFEHLALRLLRDADGQPTELCQGIRQGYAAVMVDEYQDTNALQDALYRCLASPAGDDLFLVGDLKQSIYRFRQADPSIFREKLESWPLLPGGEARPRPEDGKPGENAMLALDANFRSAPQVVAGINFIFEQLMTPALGDTAYGDGQRLVCGAPGAYRETHCRTGGFRRTGAGGQRHPPGAVRGLLCPAGGERRLPGLRRGPDSPGHPGLRRRPGEPAGRAPHPPPHRPAAGHRQPRAGHLSRCRHAGADVRLYGRRPRPPPGRSADTRSAHPHQPLRRSPAGCRRSTSV